MTEDEAALWREHDARRAAELSRLRADLADAVGVLEPLVRGYEESVRAYPLVGGETSQKTRYAKSDRAGYMWSSVGTYHFQQAAALLTRLKDTKP